MDELPSPKFQFQIVGFPVEVSENWTERGAGPDVGDAVKPATGGRIFRVYAFRQTLVLWVVISVQDVPSGLI